jgi:Second Messenger Oligonucleotide or Dinucleotide Synthetase domain
MSFVGDAFTIFLRKISPPDTQREAAERSNKALRAFLDNDSYFGKVLLDSFLNGSYARRTAVQPIKDVDIVVVVGPDWMKTEPALAMESLRSKLSERYDDRRSRRRRRAVRIELSDIRMDVVLAVAPDGLKSPLRIPDREVEEWILTHPKRQLELVKAVAAATNGNYSRLVRLLKAWALARVAAANRPRSFVLECAAYHLLSMRPKDFAGELDEAFATLLDRLHSWDFGRSRWPRWDDDPVVSDPALPDLNVAEGWEEEGADRFNEKIEVALDRLEDVERSRWEDTEVQHWGRLFGGLFPAPSTVARHVRD